MKLHPLFLFAVALLTAPAALTAADFEGKVRMKMTDPRGTAHEIDYRVKPGFVRTDIETGNGQQAAMIMDLTKQEILILMPEQNMYMVQPLATVTAAASKAAGDDFTFEKTHETEKILGYDCVKYVSKSDDLTSDIWVTEALGRFAGLGSGASPMGGGKGSAAAAWEKALAGKNFFPLRVVSHNAKGREQFRLEATAVEKGAQPAALFAAPANYQKFDLGGMMQGLGFPGKTLARMNHGAATPFYRLLRIFTEV